MKQKNDIQKRSGRAAKEGENFLSFTSAEPCSNFVYAEVETGLSPSGESCVVPLWKRLDK